MTRVSSARHTLPGRIQGRLYDERGNEVRVRAEAFNRLPAGGRPRVYDHTGLRMVRLPESGRSEGRIEPQGRSGVTGLALAVARAFASAVRMLVRLALLAARLV